MEKIEISKYRNNIYHYLENRQLIQAFDNLKIMVDATQQWALNQELERLTTSYGFMFSILSETTYCRKSSSMLSRLPTKL